VVLQAKPLYLLGDGCPIGFIRARPGEDQDRVAMFPERRRGLVQEPNLVFYGIDSAQAQQDLPFCDLREGQTRGFPAILPVNFQRHPVRLNDDFLAQEIASWFYPLETRVRVSLCSDATKSLEATITDRGPARRLVRQGRIIDLSEAAFKQSAPLQKGLVCTTVVNAYALVPSTGEPTRVHSR